MTRRGNVIRELLGESLYVIDEGAIAEAMVMRATARFVVPELAFRTDDRGPQIRSFRVHRDARSFRLSSSRRGVLHV